ncbi:MAG: hypothetical protein AB4040_02095 [Synechococcus sp.]
MKSPQPLSILSAHPVTPLSNSIPPKGFSSNASFWVAEWGDRSIEGTLSECLDFMGIYGSARNFHMREASRTGLTGGDLWQVRLLSEQVVAS